MWPGFAPPHNYCSARLPEYDSGEPGTVLFESVASCSQSSP